MRSSIICTLHEMLLCYQVKEDEKGGARRAHGRDEKYIQNFSRKN